MKPGSTLFALVAIACSSAVRPLSPAIEDDRAAAVADEQRATGLEQALSSLSSGTTAPDCNRVCDLVAGICDLTRRICAIAARHRDDPELAARCAAGEQRCGRARERVPAGCSCPRP
jgi:hypothetical protein